MHSIKFLGNFEDMTYDYDNEKEKIRNVLKKMSGERCAFCSYICNNNNIYTIEHIQPKGRYPKFKHEISNLIGCCYKCNQTASRNIGNWSNEHRISPYTHSSLDELITTDRNGMLNLNKEFSDEEFIIEWANLIDAYGLNNKKNTEKRKFFLEGLQNDSILEYFSDLVIKENNLDHNDLQFPSILMQVQRGKNLDRANLIKKKYYCRENI